MTEKEQKLKKYQEKFEQAQFFLERKYNKEFSSYFISALLGHYFESDDVHVFLIFHKEIDTIDLKTILDNEIKSLIGTLKFDSTDFDFVLSDRIEKARIKENGLIWFIHNNDRDPKPSQPHAHEYSLNVKLHLGTGELFRKGKIIDKLSKKEFKRLKAKIEKGGIKLP